MWRGENRTLLELLIFAGFKVYVGKSVQIHQFWWRDGQVVLHAESFCWAGFAVFNLNGSRRCSIVLSVLIFAGALFHWHKIPCQIHMHFSHSKDKKLNQTWQKILFFIPVSILSFPWPCALYLLKHTKLWQYMNTFLEITVLFQRTFPEGRMDKTGPSFVPSSLHSFPVLSQMLWNSKHPYILLCYIQEARHNPQSCIQE